MFYEKLGLKYCIVQCGIGLASYEDHIHNTRVMCLTSTSQYSQNLGPIYCVLFIISLLKMLLKSPTSHLPKK